MTKRLTKKEARRRVRAGAVAILADGHANGWLLVDEDRTTPLSDEDAATMQAEFEALVDRIRPLAPNGGSHG